MKLSFSTLIFLFISSFSYSQNPSMTISHLGLAPYDTLTVFVGDSIDFIYGGGGSHPMTEGWQTGESSIPIPFATQTVTSSIPSVTFTLDTPGIYYFHCAGNPANSNNWGKITVLDTAGTTGVSQIEQLEVRVFPNPVADILTIENFSGEACVYDLTGKLVMTLTKATTDVSALRSGTYIIKSEKIKTRFIKK